MRLVALAIALLYGIIIILLSRLVSHIAFLGTKAEINLTALFMSRAYWIWLVILVAGQATLLFSHIPPSGRRAATRRNLLFPIIVTALMMASLTAGVSVAIGELISARPTSPALWWSALTVLILTWILVSGIFARRSRNIDAKSFIEKKVQYVFWGSVLELLVAVPAHIFVRGKDYDYAGAATFIAIAFGIAIMLFSFGPGIFFLYQERWKYK